MSNERTGIALPHPVATAIANLRNYGLSNYGIIESITKGGSTEDTETLRNFIDSDGINRDVLLTALVNGYEVEQTPQEQREARLREYYATFDDLAESGVEGDAQLAEIKRNTLRHTLRMLGVTVEGVNVHPGASKQASSVRRRLKRRTGVLLSNEGDCT